MPDSDNVRVHKEAAVDFLQLVIAGRIDEAYRKHVDMQGKHHNPWFGAGFAALKQAMLENHMQMPNKQLTVKNVLGDGDMVAVHSRLMLRSGEQGMAVVHIFRFQGNRIVEMWDIGEATPADSPNADGRF